VSNYYLESVDIYAFRMRDQNNSDINPEDRGERERESEKQEVIK
jgi:hypothetical protein